MNTKVGLSAISPELLQHIKDSLKEYLGWEDLNDTPEVPGAVGRFLGVKSTPNGDKISWEEFPSFGLQWETATADATATDKVGYLASGGITIQLPEDPAKGTLVAIADRLGEFDTKPVKVLPGTSDTIESERELVLDLKNTYIQLIFAEDKWEITQVSHPFNVAEITEETFAPGTNKYLLSRVPPSKEALLIFADGKLIDTNRYGIVGNELTFGSVQTTQLVVRYTGVPSGVRVSDAPVGSLMMFPHRLLPDGYLPAVGGTVHRSVYPELVDYLNKGSGKDTAELPDYRGEFLRVWGGGTKNLIAAQNIPADLSDGKWGKWIDSLSTGTAVNAWDNSTGTATQVKFDKKYVGYEFDMPVAVTQVSLYTEETRGNNYLPTEIVLENSEDGITWSTASLTNTAGANINNKSYVLAATDSTPRKFWRVRGTGGFAYPSSDEYWRIKSCVFTATTTSKYVGQHANSTVGGHSHDSLRGSGELRLTQALLDTGGNNAFAIVPDADADVDVSTGSSGNGITSETAPDHTTVMVGIKAFSYQGGSLSSTDLNALRAEVAALRSQVEAS